MSMHPRVENGRTKHSKVNTAKPPRKPLSGQLLRITTKYDARQRDYQATLLRVEASQRAGFRRPNET